MSVTILCLLLARCGAQGQLSGDAGADLLPEDVTFIFGRGDADGGNPPDSGDLAGPEVLPEDGSGPWADGSGPADGTGQGDGAPSDGPQPLDGLEEGGPAPDGTVEPGEDAVEAGLPDLGPFPCTSHQECLDAAGPLPDCMTLVCVDGWCKDALAAEGASCLHPPEVPGECQHAACTIDGTCVVAADEEGSPCGVNDDCVTWACKSGQCGQSWAKPCDDGNPCTDDGCYPGTGCVHKDNHDPCEDGSACTVEDHCQLGVCSPGNDADCDDGNPCTDDMCDAVAGCFHLVNKAPCQQGDKCSPLGECDKGQCINLVPLDCNDGNPCTQDSCAPDTGCVNVPVEGVPCDDGSACTAQDACAGGSCAGTPVLCDDKNPCTDDSCEPAVGCIHAPNTGACEDGNPCTVGDVCGQGKCLAGPPAKCDDGELCTKDSCDPKTGCVHSPTSNGQCNDNNPCTLWDHCDAGKCVGLQLKQCDDGVACTTDSCNAGGNCVYTPSNAACDDKNPCTSDVCDMKLGCMHTPVVAGACDDASLCTTGDTCIAGKCVGKAKDCTDLNLCTDDTCTPATGECVHKVVGDGCDPTSVDGAVCPGGTYKFRVCQSTCLWSAWTECAGSSACANVGSTQVCGGGPNCGYQKCSLINVWGPCNDGTYCEGGANGEDACVGDKGCWDQGCFGGACKSCTCKPDGTWTTCGKCLMLPPY
jgi:hypothetical protein